jgi:transposase
MAEVARKTKRYPSDLTDEEWTQIEPLMPPPSRRGRKASVDLREVLNAIRYLARSGGGWRMLPVHFGPWQTVYWWFRRFVRRLRDCRKFRVREGGCTRSGHGSGEALAEEDGELSFGHGPLTGRHDPVFLAAVQHQIQQLHGGFVGWEMAAGAHRSA